VIEGEFRACAVRSAGGLSLYWLGFLTAVAAVAAVIAGLL
jgi:hypothetical protein